MVLVPKELAASVNRGMQKPLSVVLLLVLVALASDMMIHSFPVHAQSSSTVYVDKIDYRSVNRAATLTIKGTQVVGFSCLGAGCFVLSK